MTAVEVSESIVKPFEGLRLKPYLCPAGVPTIGFGSTRYTDGRKVTLKDAPIQKETAEIILTGELSRCESGVLKYCPILAKYNDKRGAIMDFVYNLGVGRLQASTLRRKINVQDWRGAAKELRKWVYGGGRKLPGLVLRREAESIFFLTEEE